MCTETVQEEAANDNNPDVAEEDEVDNEYIEQVEDNSDEEEDVYEGVLDMLDDSPKADLYEEGVLGLARVLVYRKGKTHPELQATQDSASHGSLPAWVDHFSRHGHATPTSKFHHQVQLMDSVFLLIHKDGIDREKEVLKRFTTKVVSMPGFQLPLPIIQAFGKLRLDVRMRVLNKRKNKNKSAVLKVNAKEKWDKNSRAFKSTKNYTC